ncbi:putative membrane protein YeaQ/YmgE (transglycosylase-associated protein family) [Catenulispora sp. GP43]
MASKVFHVTNIQGFFNISTWITAIMGAVVLLGAVKLVTGRGSAGSSPRRNARH